MGWFRAPTARHSEDIKPALSPYPVTSNPGRIVSGLCGLREQMPNFLAGCGNNPCGARQDLLRAEMVIFSGEAACTWLKRAETICDGMRRS
jgi:hypothetical protein